MQSLVFLTYFFKNYGRKIFGGVGLTPLGTGRVNILAIYLSANLAIAPCSRVAIFPRDGNAIISENCIAIAGEKLLL